MILAAGLWAGAAGAQAVFRTDEEILARYREILAGDEQRILAVIGALQGTLRVAVMCRGGRAATIDERMLERRVEMLVEGIPPAGLQVIDSSSRGNEQRLMRSGAEAGCQEAAQAYRFAALFLRARDE